MDYDTNYHPGIQPRINYSVIKEIDNPKQTYNLLIYNRMRLNML